jgi:hypothetical protein
LQYCYLISKPSDAEKNNRDTTEFTYSFHHLETALAQLRSPQQQAVYMKYKSLIYKYIKPLDGDIPSFYGKTVMFWCQEEYPPEHKLWENDNTAVEHLLDKLIVAVEEEELKYYLVPSFNVMKPLIPPTKEKVLKRLYDIRNDVEKYVKELPVEESLQFYSEIVNDCVSINKLLEMRSTEDFTNYGRIMDDQFAPLRNKLGKNFCVMLHSPHLYYNNQLLGSPSVKGALTKTNLFAI